VNAWGNVGRRRWRSREFQNRMAAKVTIAYEWSTVALESLAVQGKVCDVSGNCTGISIPILLYGAQGKLSVIRQRSCAITNPELSSIQATRPPFARLWLRVGGGGRAFSGACAITWPMRFLSIWLVTKP
jgi:hypothetical protein